MPKADPFKVLLDKADADKAEASKAEIPAADAPRTPGRVMIMSAGERSWATWSATTPVRRRNPSRAPECSASAGSAHLRRWWRWRRWPVRSAARWRPRASGISAAMTRRVSANHALEASVARIDADIQALKVGVEHASKLGMTQFNKTSERLDKVEKAQARTRRQTRQAQRGRGKAPRRAAGRCGSRRTRRREGSHRLDFASSGRAGSCAQGRSGQAADGGRLDRCATSPMAAP